MGATVIAFEGEEEGVETFVTVTVSFATLPAFEGEAGGVKTFVMVSVSFGSLPAFDGDAGGVNVFIMPSTKSTISQSGGQMRRIETYRSCRLPCHTPHRDLLQHPRGHTEPWHIVPRSPAMLMKMNECLSFGEKKGKKKTNQKYTSRLPGAVEYAQHALGE